MKRKKIAKRKTETKILGLSPVSWVIIVVLAIITVLPDFPIDIISGIVDFAFLVWTFIKK